MVTEGASTPAAARRSWAAAVARWHTPSPAGSAVSALLALVLAVLVLPPLIFLASSSLAGPDGALGVGNFVALATSRGFLSSAANSFVFAVGSMVVAIVFGASLAWIAERTNAPGRGLAYFTTVLSLGTPYVLYVSAWILLLARSGPLNATWRDLTGATAPLVDVYSQGGMIFIEGLLWSPFVFLLLGATLRNANMDHEDAARMSGAGLGQILARIVLPLSAPALGAICLLVFIRSLEAFEVPALVGRPGKVHVLTTDVYEAMHVTNPPNVGAASAMSMVLLIVVAVLLSIYSRLLKVTERYATITGRSFRPRIIDLGGWRWLASAVVMLNFVLLIVLPVSILAWASLLPFYQSFRWTAVRLLSLKNYETVLANDRYLGLLSNTLVIAAVTASVVMALTALASWIIVRRGPGGRVLDQLATAPLVFPGLVLGIGVMQFWLALPSVGVYGSIAIIMWALVINYLPYGTRYSVAGVIQISRDLESAAEVSGASRATVLVRVVLPLMWPAIVSGWLFVFLLACRVLSVPVLLSGPTSQTMAVAMFDLWSNGQTPELAALGLLYSLLMTAVAAVFHVVSRRAGAQS